MVELNQMLLRFYFSLKYLGLVLTAIIINNTFPFITLTIICQLGKLVFKWLAGRLTIMHNKIICAHMHMHTHTHSTCIQTD